MNVRLHNAIVEGKVPPPPGPETPGPILAGLLTYMASHREAHPDEAIDPAALLQVLAHLIDHHQWEEMARMCLAMEEQSSLVVPGRS